MNSFVGLSGGDQVSFPDDLMNCRPEVAVELNALFDNRTYPWFTPSRLS